MKSVPTAHDSNLLELGQARQLSSFVSEIAGDFLKAFNLSHIWLSKYFFDGRYMDLTNDIEWKDIMVQNHFYQDYIRLFLQPLSTRTVNNNTLFLSWQSIENSSDCLIKQTGEYGILSGFNLMFIHKNHIENYGFGSPLEIGKILFDRAEIELFALYLREKIAHFMELKPLALGVSGEEFSPPSPKCKYLHTPIPESFTFSCNSVTTKLTLREVQCLSLMAQGLSQKEVGRILEVSPRTIEFHFNQIKDKLNKPSKLELFIAFKTSPLTGLDPFLLLNNS